MIVMMMTQVMMMTKNKIIDLDNIIYTKGNTHVPDSYLIKDKKEIKKYVIEIIKKRNKLKLPVTRNEDSYVREWIAHNRVCALGIFRNHTRDVDLNENNTLLAELAWKIFGGF